MKNILFISYDGLTDPLGQSQVIPYLSGLTKYGYRFTILSCEKPERYSLHKKEIESLLEQFSITWVPLKYHKAPTVFSTVYDVYHLRKKVKKLHAKEKFDMVHTRAGIPALVGLWLKKNYAVKFLNDIREFYADSRIEGGMWDTDKFFYKKIYLFFQQKEKEETLLSDGIVCLTKAAENIIINWPEYNKEIPLQVIPCSADISLFDPEKIDNSQKIILKNELKIKDEDCIITYLGSIGSWYLIEEMMQFFKIISDKIPNAKFLFISPSEHEVIIAKAKKFGLSPNKLIIKQAKRNDVPALLSLSKFSVFFIKSCYSKQSSSPTKHGEIMAMGIPVITNSGVGDVAEIVQKYHSGIVLKELNESEFQQTAELICKENSFDKAEIRKGAEEFYNLDRAIEKYHEIYKQILA
ncbi:MAG: glycosyltransferase [Ginsengibacter sp.]